MLVHASVGVARAAVAYEACGMPVFCVQPGEQRPAGHRCPRLSAINCRSERAQSVSTLVCPLSFATFMERKNERTGEYRHLASGAIHGWKYEHCAAGGKFLELADSAEPEEAGQPIRLLPRSRLFTAFQRSLSDEQQAVLTRWAAADYRDGDEQLSAVGSPAGLHEEDFRLPVNARSCPHPLLFHCRNQAREETQVAHSSERKADVDDGESETDDDE